MSIVNIELYKFEFFPKERNIRIRTDAAQQGFIKLACVQWDQFNF